MGTVFDPQGSVVPDAVVTVVNAATQIKNATKARGDGSFEVPSLPIGTYYVEVEKEGFEEAVTQQQKLEINQSLQFQVILTLGATTQTVTVEAAVSAVEIANPTVGDTVTGETIQEAPLNGRDTLGLALLQPGVTEADPDYGGAGALSGSHRLSGAFSVAGGRPDSITFLLDGGLNNSLINNEVVLNPNPDSIAEFRILTSNYTAEYGRNGSGIISVVTKSGTNQLHGSAFDFVRNTDFDANSYFNLQEGLPRDDLKRHQFGGTFGGPIEIPHALDGKDRFFFFVAYQGQRQTQSLVQSEITTFTPAELGGNFSGDPVAGPNVASFLQANPYFQSNPALASEGVIDPTKINPVSAKYIALGLIPTSPTGLVSSQGTEKDNSNELTGKLDFRISPKDTLAITIGGSREGTLEPFSPPTLSFVYGSNAPGFPYSGATNNYFANIAYTRIISADMLNEFRVTAQRSYTLTAKPAATLPTPAKLGFGITPDLPTGPPALSFDSGLDLGFNYVGPTTGANDTYAFSDALTWVKGRNTWKFGGGFSAYQNNELYDFYGSGIFSFIGDGGSGSGSSFADFLLGIPSFLFQGPDAANNIRSKATYGFLQDEWRVKSKLTLTLGVRYEYNTPKLDTAGRSFSVIPGLQSTRFPNAPVGLVFPGDKGAPRGVNFPDKDNFAPRIGFAWAPGNGKTSIRGGFGVFYDVLKGEDNLQFNGAPPFYSEASANGGNLYPSVGPGSGQVPYFADPWLTADGGINPFPSKPPAANVDFVTSGFMPYNNGFALYVVDPHLHTPYTYQYNLSVQHELANNLIMEASYVGSSSKGLTAVVDRNPFVLGTFNRVLNLAPQSNGEINSFCAGLDKGECPFGTVPEFTNVGFASYNSLEASLTKRLADSRRFGSTSFTLSYTYGHNIDDTSGFRQNRENNVGQVPAYAVRSFRASSDFDITNRIVLSGGWDLPIDRAWSSGPQWLLKSWSLAPIFSWRTGFPLSIPAQLYGGFASIDTPGPSAAGDPAIANAIFASGFKSIPLENPRTNANVYFNPAAFTTAQSSDTAGNCSAIAPNEFPSDAQAVNCPSLRTYGLPRNFFRAPGRTNLDLALAKKVAIRENLQGEFRVEAFNLFNHAEFQNPDTIIFSGTFGQVTKTYDPRIIQLALRLSF